MSAKKKKTNKKPADPINSGTGLSEKQEEFARQYICPTPTSVVPKLTEFDKPFNGTRAAIRAGYAEKSARGQATRLLANANIQLYMAELKRPAQEKFKITRERVLQEMASLAFSNVLDFVTVCPQTGQAWIDISKCSREEAAALSKFEVTELPPQKMIEGGEEVMREVLRTKIAFYDKKPVLEMLAKREDLLKPDMVDVNVTGKMDDTDKMEIAKRVAFMLRQAAEEKKKEERANTAKSGPAKAKITDKQ